MQVTDYLRSVAYSHAWFAPQLAAKRVAFATANLERRLNERDWETVAFAGD
jgi:hypothetical protein